jgi:hypothetical protein
MKISRVQEAIKILKASVGDSAVGKKERSHSQPKKSTTEAKKARKPPSN